MTVTELAEERPARRARLVEQFERGLAAPICLTWS